MIENSLKQEKVASLNRRLYRTETELKAVVGAFWMAIGTNINGTFVEKGLEMFRNPIGDAFFVLGLIYWAVAADRQFHLSERLFRR